MLRNWPASRPRSRRSGRGDVIIRNAEHRLGQKDIRFKLAEAVLGVPFNCKQRAGPDSPEIIFFGHDEHVALGRQPVQNGFGQNQIDRPSLTVAPAFMQQNDRAGLD